MQRLASLVPRPRNSGATFPEQVMNSALQYQIAKPIVDAVMKDAGLSIFTHYGWALPLCALIIATASAALTAAWLLEGLKRYGLRPFGFYRLALGGFLLWTAAHTPDQATKSPAAKNSSR